jgi:outer membrane cobalamin receptor
MRIFIFLVIPLVLSSFFLFSDETDDVQVIEGDELVIMGNRDSSPQKNETITKDQIEKMNPKDLSDLLSGIANLTINQNGGYGTQATVSIRGNNSSDVLVLINGIPVNSSQSGDADLSAIPVGNIKKIEITRGGSDMKYNYSGAIGGIINIITEEKKQDAFYIDLSISNQFYYPEFYYEGSGKSDKKFPGAGDFFDTQKIVLNMGAGAKWFHWDYGAGGNIAQNHFLYMDTNDILRRMKNSEVWDINVGNTFRIDLPLYMKLVLSNTMIHSDKNVHGSINNSNFGNQTVNNILSYISYSADMIGTDKISAEITVSHKFKNLKWHDDFDNDVHDLNSIMAVNRWNFLPFEWFVIQVGGDFMYDILQSTKIGEKDLFNGGGYVSVEFSIKKIAKITGSVKINYDKKFGETVPVIPKIGVIFFIGRYFTLKSNFFRSFRNPTFNDLYWPKESYAEGNPELKPETGLGGDITLKFAREKILNAESTVFVNYLKDAIKWAPDQNKIWKPQNVGKSFYFGLENTVKSDFSKYIEIAATYNFLMTWVLSDDLSFESDKRMTYSPLHVFGFKVTVNWNPGKKYDGNISMVGHYESAKFTDLQNLKTLSPYFSLDISFNQRLTQGMIFFASIKNMFNDHYFLVDGYPVPAGSITMGIKINYKTKTIDEKEEKEDAL